MPLAMTTGCGAMSFSCAVRLSAPWALVLKWLTAAIRSATVRAGQFFTWFFRFSVRPFAIVSPQVLQIIEYRFDRSFSFAPRVKSSSRAGCGCRPIVTAALHRVRSPPSIAVESLVNFGLRCLLGDLGGETSGRRITTMFWAVSTISSRRSKWVRAQALAARARTTHYHGENWGHRCCATDTGPDRIPEPKVGFQHQASSVTWDRGYAHSFVDLVKLTTGTCTMHSKT